LARLHLFLAGLKPANAREIRRRLDEAAKLYATTARRLGVPAKDAIDALRRQWEQ
jgi:hypothetical protein